MDDLKNEVNQILQKEGPLAIPKTVAGIETPPPVSEGSEEKGKFKTIAEANWNKVMKPNVIYEFLYEVPKRAWYEFWLWFWTFDPASATQEIRKNLSTEMGVGIDEINVIWWEYLNEAMPPTYTLQLSYVPKQAVATQAVAALPVIAVIALIKVAIICGTAVWLAKLFTKEPVLIKIKELLPPLSNALKWITAIAAITGGVYVLSKLAPLLKKNK